MKAENPFQSGHNIRNLAVEGLLAALLWLLPAAAQGQAIEAWVQRFDAARDVGGYLPAMAVDAAGDVVVTAVFYGGDPVYGGTSLDWATLKYSSAGVALWTNYYNGPGNLRDSANAVALDASGNVLVTGSSMEVDGSERCTTIKYSSEGTPLWTNRYTTGEGFGVSLAIDATGNVYVTGLASGAGGANPNILTIKYSSQGVLLWARQYDGPGNSDDHGSAVATDSNGNVLVAGQARTGLDNYAVTLKYSSAGTPLWTRLYRGLNLFIQPLAVDGSNNVVVTGSFYLPGVPTYDILTIKYTSAGVPIWTNRYDGPANGSDSRAVGVDASGNVYVTGEADVSDTIADYATIKYTSAGVALWTNLYGGPGRWLDLPYALTLDASGNVFVTGTSCYTGGSDSAYATVAYSSAGLPLWSKLYNGPGNYIDDGQAIAVDASGNVFVAGQSQTSSGNTEYATIKYVIPPIITRQPVSCTNTAGTTASFTVEVAGSAPFGYQWRLEGTNLVDGGNLSGVTTTKLLIANVQTAAAGGYSVVVTNAYGSATSRVAQLTVTIPPSPGRFSNLSYSPETGFSFIFRDGTLGRQYRIQTSSSLAAGSWVDWQSFTYNGPAGFMDVSAIGAERRFYRAVSP